MKEHVDQVIYNPVIYFFCYKFILGVDSLMLPNTWMEALAVNERGTEVSNSVP